MARLGSDPAAALEDFDQALALQPPSLSALQNKAHVLAEHLGRNRDALAVLDRLVERCPPISSRVGEAAASFAPAFNC